MNSLYVEKSDETSGGKSIVVTSSQSIAPVQGDVNVLSNQITQLQALTATPPAKSFRRVFFFWLRIYVNDRGDNTRVNLHIPIPLPLLGTLLPRQLSASRALMLRSELQNSDDQAATMHNYLEATMAVEFVRVDDEETTVVIGLD